MKLPLGLCTFFQLLLSSSSSFCGIRDPQRNWFKVTPGLTHALDAPWLVNIIGNEKRCQGVILSNWWILTAANCFLLMEPSQVELIGAHEHISTVAVSQFIPHLSLSSWLRPPNNDLGLLLLGQPVDLEKEMWPVCIPHSSQPSMTQVRCNIYERDPSGFRKKSLKRVSVQVLLASECAKHWPDSTEQWNLCIASKVHGHIDCKVPVGSPILCHNPTTEQWELMGIVSQSLQNCTTPLLASQLIPHLEWLWQQGALVRPRHPHFGHIKTIRGKEFSSAAEPPSTTTIALDAMSQTRREFSPTSRKPVLSTTEQLFQTAMPTYLRTPTTSLSGPIDLQLPTVPGETVGITRISMTTGHSLLKARKPHITPTTAGHSTHVKFSKGGQSSTVANNIIFIAPPTITPSLQVTSTTAAPATHVKFSKAGQFPTVGNIISVAPPTIKPLHVTPTAAGHTICVKFSKARQSPAAGNSTIFVAPPTIKPLQVTSTAAGYSTYVKFSRAEESSRVANKIIFVAPPTTKASSHAATTTERHYILIASSKVWQPSSTTTKITFAAPPTIEPLSHKTSTTEGHYILVESSKVRQPPLTTNQINYVAPSTIKPLSPMTPTMRQSLPTITKPLPEKYTTITHSPLVTSSKASQSFTIIRQSSVVTFTHEPYSSVTPTRRPLSPQTRNPHYVQSTTAGRSSKSSTTVKRTHVVPTIRHSSPATPTLQQLPHIIIPAAVRQSKPITSPVSTVVHPRESPSPTPPTDFSASHNTNIPFIAAGPQFPQSKSQEPPPVDPSSLPLPAPLSTSMPITPRLQFSLRVRMGQCEIGLAWNTNSHTYQLNKMAILMEREVGCGLRQGFVPKCPSCSEAEMGEFPWIVSLKLSIQHFCAGSILNPWWILTTASCANLIRNSESLALVQAGLVDVSRAIYSVQIHQTLTHPQALENQDLHNLGLLQLEKPLEFGPLVAPICVSEKAKMIGEFRDCWLPGWTVLEGGPTTMLRRPLDILSISNCSPLGEEFSNAIFCIKAQKDQEGVCKGDVGSPLICPDPQGGAWLQLGVLSSFDEACSRPYIFSSLLHYLPWLERTTRAAGHNYNRTVPQQRSGPAQKLRVLPKPETLVKRISAHFALPWQVLVATCGNRSCGGSILNHYWVLTTAQCVREADPASTAIFVGLTHPKGHSKAILVAGIYPHKGISGAQNSFSGEYNIALLLLKKPISFGRHVTHMTFSLMETWDSCKVMGLQMLQTGAVETDPAAFQAKVLEPSDCAKQHPGVHPAMYCIVRNSSSSLPAAAIVEGAALLCHMKAQNTTWSQVGLTSDPFPGSQPVVLSSSIASYVDWMEETSREARRLLSPLSARAACGSSSWVLLLILSLFGGAELG